jgi:hypothetical protein
MANERVECGCKLWKKNIQILESVIMNAWVHGMSYSGKQFKFCPWCSGLLRRYTDEKEIEPEY